jgi:hypothetical protein
MYSSACAVGTHFGRFSTIVILNEVKDLSLATTSYQAENRWFPGLESADGEQEILPSSE